MTYEEILSLSPIPFYINIEHYLKEELLNYFDYFDLDNFFNSDIDFLELVYKIYMEDNSYYDYEFFDSLPEREKIDLLKYKTRDEWSYNHYSISKIILYYKDLAAAIITVEYFSFNDDEPNIKVDIIDKNSYNDCLVTIFNKIQKIKLDELMEKLNE